MKQAMDIDVLKLIEALFVIWIAIHSFLYYAGRLHYTDEKEKRRKEVVKKYEEFRGHNTKLLTIGAEQSIVCVWHGWHA